jgi:hypothetical protein
MATKLHDGDSGGGDGQLSGGGAGGANRLARRYKFYQEEQRALSEQRQRELLASSFSHYLTQTQIVDAFKCIIQEILQKRPKQSEVFQYAARRLR